MQHLPQAYNNVGSVETFGMYLNAAQQDMADAAEAEANEKAAKKTPHWPRWRSRMHTAAKCTSTRAC